MKTNTMKSIFAVGAMTFGVIQIGAAAPSLSVGDPAPALQTGDWVQGEAVEEFEKGKAYLVEFWATWCGPCRTSIPHLNELHDEFKDKGLVVIGQDCWEQDESQVRPFIESMGKKMTYRVVLDDKEGSERGRMSDTWMTAAGRSGIPSAFLVDTKGRLAWIGHPMQLKPELIESVLSGRFDLRKAVSDYRKAQAADLEMRTLWPDLNNLMRAKKWDEAEARLLEAQKLFPADQRGNLDTVRFNILLGKKDTAAAFQLAREVSDAGKDNAMLQNQLAWLLVTDKAIDKPDLALAELIATRANDAANGEDPAILDTLARVLFMKGEKEEAIRLQEKAVRYSEGPLKKQLREVLASYRKGVLPEPE